VARGKVRSVFYLGGDQRLHQGQQRVSGLCQGLSGRVRGPYAFGQSEAEQRRKQGVPWIFGFSGIKGGLDPFRQLLRERLKCGFARRFAHWILEGKKPEDAFVKARRDVYGNELLVKFIHPRQKRNQKQKAAGEEELNFSDKQLERDLQEAFQLKKLPRTRKEWLPEIHRFERLVSSDNH